MSPVEFCPGLLCSVCISYGESLGDLSSWLLDLLPHGHLSLFPSWLFSDFFLLVSLSPEIGSPAFSSSLPSPSLSQLFIGQSEMTKQFLHDIEIRDAWPCHGPDCRLMSGHRNQHLNTRYTRPTTQHSYIGCRLKHSILHGSPLSRKANDSK